jgi:small-conductance mechanosensitive channel
MAQDATPQTVQQIRSTLKDTILDVWQNFLEHTRYIVAGLIVLVITWIASIIVTRLALRALRKAVPRQSLLELIRRFISIGVWVLGLLLAAMVVFPGLTPAKALGGLGIASIAVGFAFKDIFENFFAGILLLWRFPYRTLTFKEPLETKFSVKDNETSPQS